jgi:hypothetical protein
MISNKRRWIGSSTVVIACTACSADDAGGSNPPPTSTPQDELVAAFTTSACTRLVECQAPNAGQCAPYTEQQLRSGLAALTWTDTQIDGCTTAREALLDCIEAATCAAIIAVSDCVPEKQSYLTVCEPLLTALARD